MKALVLTRLLELIPELKELKVFSVPDINVEDYVDELPRSLDKKSKLKLLIELFRSTRISNYYAAACYLSALWGLTWSEIKDAPPRAKSQVPDLYDYSLHPYKERGRKMFLLEAWTKLRPRLRREASRGAYTLHSP